MPKTDISKLKFSVIYPLYVQKAERKGRGRGDVDRVIGWLTGYDTAGLDAQVAAENDLRAFFQDAPRINPNRALITGVVCGVRVEDIEDPLEQLVRYMDKLIDELARGKAMDKILRQP